MLYPSGKKTSYHLWLLVLISWNVLTETAGQKPPQGFRYASYEVTIPRKLTPRYGQQEPDVTYLLQIDGKGHVVHLKQKKGFVSKHFPVFTYSKEGDLQVDYPFIRDDCFYRGFIQGKPFSLVTLSTCSGGLRGLLRLENQTYEIVPVQASATSQHVVYRLEEKGGAVRMNCGLTEEEQSRQVAMIQKSDNIVAKDARTGDWWTHTRYAEVAIVVDYERYDRIDRNETVAAMNVLDVIHVANSLYEPLSVLVTLAGLEIWTEKNLIVIDNNINTLLSTFNDWRTNTLNKHLKNDAGHLFVYKSFGRTRGLAYLGTICRTDRASGVESYVGYSLSDFSNTFVHELGHNLGMQHDGKYCTCERHACIMAASQANTDKFSNCSYNDYFELRNSPCLLIPPHPDKMYKLKRCGNKVVEDGEQCDCGSPDQCKSDTCCQSNCMLRPAAMCAFGQCCAKCQYVPAQSVCRQQISICDLPEYCNGTSEWCPEDVYVQDGAPCSDGAYCYHGNCTTHNGQCKMIFGKKATVASKACFMEVNGRGDRFGNCGLYKFHVSYKKCNAKNILCGRIQCDNVNELPSLEEHSTIVQTYSGNRQCWGTDYHSGMEIPDIGAVRDGVPCGTDMMCIDGQCMSVSLLKYDCDVRKCHNRGICNTHRHCHCDYGWAPPDCVNEGYGGSIDSGPPPPSPDIVIAATSGGIAFVITATGVVSLCVYFRYGLMHHLRRLRARFRPTESKQEESPQQITELNNSRICQNRTPEIMDSIMQK
ncbi:disintegrin and metalloproteinase domain-containing protein 20-like [Rhineura floridana]|uniref:disintegrin and metalloproteinase domain-containing protein 20-like n=1 Tax=Rhineura floridana TaxID=261503 RepID=UPI002AC8689A|nr:disintegrin and metalloproteinase domain-containing protein 20-like [Rhineura floridana]